MRDEVRPNHQAVIHGAVLDGPHEGLLRIGSATEWMQLPTPYGLLLSSTAGVDRDAGCRGH